MTRIGASIQYAVWKTLGSKSLFLGFVSILVAISCVPISVLSEISEYWPFSALFQMRREFAPGFWQSLVAALVMAWLVYIFRVRIRRFFQPQMTYVRAPLMLGVAPLIVARTEGIWDQHGLNLDLDFRYAGKGALDDLGSGACPIAVASDIAVCAFIEKLPRCKLAVIPFVRIVDHLKILVRKTNGRPDDVTMDALTRKTVGYYPDSVHNHFLMKLGLFDLATAPPLTNVLDCYHALAVTKEVDACVLWEPHYRAFSHFADIHIIDDPGPEPYEWFLCLVAKKEYVLAHADVSRRILAAMKSAAEYCEHHGAKVVEGCAAFLHSEFTGIGQDQLAELLGNHNHHFGVDEALTPFLEKLDRLGREQRWPGYGAMTLKTSLWTGLERV